MPVPNDPLSINTQFQNWIFLRGLDVYVLCGLDMRAESVRAESTPGGCMNVTIAVFLGRGQEQNCLQTSEIPEPGKA